MAKTSILSVKITGDAASAVKALDRAQQATQHFSLKNTALFGAVAGGVSKAVGMAIDYVSGLAGEMVAASDSTDKFKQTLNFAGIDNKTIAKLTKSTQEYADKTVYDLNDIRNATAQLAANGVKGYDKIAVAAGNLNAVAGGTAESYGRLSTAIVQVNAANKLQTQDWNQIRDAIPGASGKIKQALSDIGAYSGDFSKAMSKGEISADEFNQALMHLGLTDAAAQAAQSTSTFEGAIGNFEASVVKAGTAFLDFVKPLATPLISSAADAVSNIASHINPEEFSKGAKAAADFAKNLWDITGGSIPLVKNIQDFVSTNLPEWLDRAKSSASDFIQKLGVKDISTAAQKITDFAGGLANVVNYATPVVITIGLATGAIRAMYAVMTAGGILQWVSNLQLVTSATSVWTTVTNAAKDAQAMFNLVMEANPIMVIVTLLAALTAGLVWFFTQTKIGQQAWQAFTSFLSNAFSSISAWASATWNSVSAWAGTAVNAVKAYWSGVTGFWSGLWNGIVNLARSAGQGIVNGFNGIVSTVRGIADAIAAPFKAAFGAIRSAWNSTVGGKGFDIPSWIPGLGGKSFKIPMLATGGTITSSGWTLVGENGPEFLNLGRGASVVPLNRAKYAVNGNGGTVINITVNGAIDKDGTAKTILALLRNYEGARS